MKFNLEKMFLIINKKKELLYKKLEKIQKSLKKKNLH